MSVRTLSLVLAAGTVCSTSVTTTAQSADTAEVQPTLPRGGPAGAAFIDRSGVLTVYNAVYDECPSSAFAFSASYMMEDVSFEPGPWGHQYNGPRDVLHVDDMFQSSGWIGTPNYPDTNTPACRITHSFEFFEPGNFTNTPMLGNATPIAVRNVHTHFGSGFSWNYTSAAFTQPVSLGTRVAIWVAIKAVDTATGQRLPDGSPGLIQPTGQTNVSYGKWLGRVGAPCTGGTSPDFAAERNPSSPTGTPTDFDDTDRRTYPRSLSLGLRGIVVPGCDPIDFNNDALFPDTLDIEDFLVVFAGGVCSNDPHCGDVDFNNDGLFPDTLDIDAILSVFSGGPCLR